MDGTVSNALAVFHYIHQNAMRAGMVKKMEGWSFSSFQDYLGIRQGKLCRIDLGVKLLDLDLENFYEHSYQVIPKEKERVIF